MAGLQEGHACGVFLLPGFRSAALAPRLLETQPSCATRTLKRSYRKIIKDDEDLSNLPEDL